MTSDDLALDLVELITLDPEIDNPNEEDSPRRLSSLSSNCDGWCPFVEEKVTFWLKDKGWQVGYADLFLPCVGWFPTHYVTVVAVEDTEDWVVVDFSAAQVPGFTPDAFPVQATLNAYQEATGLVLSDIKEID